MASFGFNFFYASSNPASSTKTTTTATDLTGPTNNVVITEQVNSNSLTPGEEVTISVAGGPAATYTYVGKSSGNNLVFQSGTTYYVASNSSIPNTEVNFSTNSSQGTFTCLLAGTIIDTSDGPVEVEALQPGHLILCSDGLRAVRFVSRSVNHPLVLSLANALPICIRAGAFGDAGPKRDLYVTGDHAIFVDGHLIHASALINGTTVVRTSPEDWQDCNSITFYNVELEDQQHAIIRAEGLEVESYVDNVPRKTWDNYEEYLALCGSESPIREMPHPRIKFARQIPASLRLKLQLSEQPASQPELATV